MKPTFFKSGSEFRAWLETHHGSAKELLVGFYKKGSGIPSITYPEALDEALAFGWIDGVRRSMAAGDAHRLLAQRRANSDAHAGAKTLVRQTMRSRA